LATIRGPKLIVPSGYLLSLPDDKSFYDEEDFSGKDAFTLVGTWKLM